MKSQRIALAVALTVSTLVSLPALAQRGGGRGGYGPSGGSGSGGQMGGMGQGMGRGTGQGQGQRQGDRQRLHAPAPQSPQLRDCDGSALQARDHARDLARSARRGPFDAETARRDRDRLHQQVDRMFQGYDEFRQGLAPGDATRLRDHDRDLREVRDRLHQELRALDASLDAPSPDRETVAQRARSVARATRDWQMEIRALGLVAGT